MYWSRNAYAPSISKYTVKCADGWLNTQFSVLDRNGSLQLDIQLKRAYPKKKFVDSSYIAFEPYYLHIEASESVAIPIDAW